jgi:ATP-dependent helicase/nuclease subunit B
LRFTTVLGLAERVAGPILGSEGVVPTECGLGPALCLELLLDLPNDIPKYFRKIAEQPGVGDALWKSISDLRLAGLYAADLTANAFSSPEKHAELSALLGAYERYLSESSLADGADLLRTAIRAPRKSPVTPGSELLEMPGSCSSTLEREFLDGLPAERVATRVPKIPGITRLASCSGPNGILEPVAIPTAISKDSDRLAWIAAPTDATAALNDGTLELFRAAGREAEIEEVLRRILRLGVPFDSVEVICARPAEYAPLFWEKASRLGIPLTLESGIPGLLTRPVRSALALCDWIESDFAAVRLARMFEAGLIAPTEDSSLTASSAAGVLRLSGATAGRTTYEAALTALASSSEDRSRDLELDEDVRDSSTRRAVRARALAVWISALLDSIPVPDVHAAEGVRLAQVVATVRQLLSVSTSVAGHEDAAAREAAIACLATLTPLAELIRPMSFAFALIRERLESIVVLTSRPRPGAVHLSPLTAMGHSGRPVTFVVGLDEGSVFPATFEDPVLLDDEREQIAGGRLRRSADFISEEVYAALTRLATLSGRVTLSYSSRDLRNGRQTYPSWLVFHACQLIRPVSTLKHDDLVAFLGEPVTLIASRRDDAPSDLGWWLSSVRGIGPAAMPAVARAFPGIGQGLTAEAARESESFTAYDGFVPAAGVDLDPRKAGHVYSASGLERFARCPFRFFLERGLGLDPEQDEEPDPDTWLDPMERGSFLHDIYRDFLRELRKQARRPAEADWEMLWSMAARSLDSLHRKIPPPSETVYRAEVKQVERDLRLFLHLEMGRKGVEPVAVEVPFGFAEADPEESLSRSEPIEISLGNGHSVHLRGRIDRIDRLAPDRFEVIDYKTGRLIRDAFTPPFAGGLLLQHALYADAAQQMLADAGIKTRQISSSYYFCTERAWGEWVQKGPALDVRPVLQDLAEALGAGVFLRGGEEANCRYCDYARACSASEVRQAAVKSGDSQPGVQALNRLRAHE